MFVYIKEIDGECSFLEVNWNLLFFFVVCKGKIILIYLCIFIKLNINKLRYLNKYNILFLEYILLFYNENSLNYILINEQLVGSCYLFFFFDQSNRLFFMQRRRVGF